MKYSILHGDTFPVVECHLNSGEKIFAESNSMVAMDSTVDVCGKMRGGLLGGLARTFLTGESFFLQELVASRGSGKVLLAPAIPGGIMDIELDGTYEFAVQKGGFLVATENVKVGTKLENLARSFFSGFGLFIVKVSGKGTTFVNGWGGVHALELKDNEEILIDNSHLLAWPTYMDFSLEKSSGSWFSSFTSGEVLVCRFKGPGIVLIQTRNFSSFTSLIEGIVKNVTSS